MTQTPVPSLILRLSCSTVVSMLAGTTYNIVDMYFVSDLGTSAVAAVGILFSVLAMIQAVGYTFGMGAGSRISRFLGEQKEKEAGRDASAAVLMALVAGLILMAAGFLWQKPLIDFLGSTDTIEIYALDYGFWILLTAPVMCVSYVLNNVLRAEGMPVWALVGIGSGAVLNAVLDPILVSGLELGIRGAGIATFCGQSVSLAIMLIVMLSGKSVIGLNKADSNYKPAGIRVKIEKIKREDKQRFQAFRQTAIDITRTGIPSFFRQGLVHSHKYNMIYRIIFSLVVYIGATTSLDLAWNFSDIANALMAIPNLICLLLLSKEIATDMREFQKVLAEEKAAKKRA